MKKISFKNLSNDEILTRDELKKVVGGNGSGPDSGGGANCQVGSCSVFDGNTGKTYKGQCQIDFDYVKNPNEPIEYACFCKTEIHSTPPPLSSNGGISRCYR